MNEQAQGPFTGGTQKSRPDDSKDQGCGDALFRHALGSEELEEWGVAVG